LLNYFVLGIKCIWCYLDMQLIRTEANIYKSHHILSQSYIYIYIYVYI
jgi:hypothetical protein